MIKKKDIVNEVRKNKNDILLELALVEYRNSARNGVVNTLLERIDYLEKYLGISFSIEKKPEVITKGYKKVKKNK